MMRERLIASRPSPLNRRSPIPRTLTPPVRDSLIVLSSASQTCCSLIVLVA